MSTSETPDDGSRAGTFAQRLAALSPAKRALLEIEIGKRRAGAAAAARVPRRSMQHRAPLSFSQRRLWFLSQLEPASVAYNEPKVYRISGSLDVEALQDSLNEIVARHEVLRTTYALGEREPEQQIHPTGVVDLSLIDLCSWPEAVREIKAREILQESVRRPFDLTADLMLRSSLLRLSEREHILLLVTHHIASDGWSMGILTRELGAFYESFVSGRPPALTELPIQYADYAEWQREHLEEEVLERQVSYWTRQLSGTPTLDLPTDRPRPRVQLYDGATQEVWLPKALCRELKRLSKANDTTLFMTLLASFQVLLSRYSGQEDVAVGSPTAGRTHSDLEGLIGFFVNTLVWRTTLSGNPTFREVLRRVKDVTWRALEHQDVPFERIVSELQPERNLGRNPFFDVVFAFQNMPTEALRLLGHTVTPIELDSGTAKFDLTLTLVEEDEEIKGQLGYRLDLFDAATIRRLLDHFETLLRSIATAPDTSIADLRLLTDGEEHQLLVDWNRTAGDYPRDRCVHELFEAQVLQSPDAVAVSFEDQQLTYGELNRRANQLAHYLSELKLDATPLVGICIDRSPEMVVALLGILKSGGAYLPLDPGYPDERLVYMLRDSGARLVLTTAHRKTHLAELGVNVVCVDTDRGQIELRHGENPPNQTMPHDLAYVMYTSGSTGQPKGVEIPHRGIVRLLCGSHYVRLDTQQTLLHLAPISFDASTFEIWGALLHGGRCVVYSGAVPRSTELGAVLKRHRVNTLWLTASLFNVVIDEDPDALSDVRQLVIGGEALSVPHVERALMRLPDTQIINGYGPTESTTFACTYPIPPRLQPAGASIPIGKPISNTRVYILDSRMMPVPIGVPGELYIGGDGLARGYVNEPGRTAERFVVKSFGDRSRERVYRTGDRARYRADGNIEFLGRLDDQVKIRGFRIEPGEIEATLAEHPGVRESAVLVREDQPGDKRLVAYLSAAGSPVVTAADLRTFVRGKLPDYMVPSAFVFVDAWALTPNGKVDRRALAATDVREAANTESFVACRTPLERQLAEIWEGMLRVKTGVTDNFFDLGGHSLLAVRIAEQIQKVTGRTLPLTSFFESPTIEGLARVLSGESPPMEWKVLLPVKPKGSRPPFFWVHGQASDPLLPRYLHPEQPLYGLMHQAHDGGPAHYTSVEGIAAYYLQEVRSVQPRGPYLLGGYCFGGVVAFEMARQLERDGESVRLLVLLSPSPLQHLAPRPGQRAAYVVRVPGPSFGDELVKHLRAMRQYGLAGRFACALRRMTRRASQCAASIRHQVNRRLPSVYVRLGYPLPVSLRSPYVLEVYRRALRCYAPTAFTGSAIIFVEEEGANGASTWRDLATEGVQIRYLRGEHTNLLEEPHIRMWAEQVGTLLNAAAHDAPQPSRAIRARVAHDGEATAPGDPVLTTASPASDAPAVRSARD